MNVYRKLPEVPPTLTPEEELEFVVKVHTNPPLDRRDRIFGHVLMGIVLLVQLGVYVLGVLVR